jgi:hypothetical protein
MNIKRIKYTGILPQINFLDIFFILVKIMIDSDDEHPYMGTSSNTNKEKIDPREVRDKEGRQRLHGAFQGGFSAGYFNTVGSKEGYQINN